MLPVKVENFILKDQQGGDFELYKNLDKKILLVFYPKDKSPVCSLQLADYQKNINLFKSAGILPVGINTASITSHKSFCDHKGITFPILSDDDKTISRRFNALNIFSGNKRKIVLIDNSGEVKYQKDLFPYKYDSAGKILNELRSRYII